MEQGSPVWPSVTALVASGLVLIVVGSKLTRLVDRIADRTGLGEAVAGALLLGATTSLPGLVTTVVAAADARPNFAISNAIGGIAAQTMFLAVADVAYRRANLEHAAASVPNLLQSLLLITMVGTVLLGTSSPDVTLLGIHPITPLLLGMYGYGLYLVRAGRREPMWEPLMTVETRTDVPDEQAMRQSLAAIWTRFAVMAVTVAGAGYVVARAGLSLAEATPLSDTLVGGLFTSITTSLPELVTVLAAVRIGALTLAVGDIIGGNTFDVLFVSAADAVYRDGSIYHAVDQSVIFLLALTVVLTGVLAGGQVHRGERGIGFEGLAILALYVAGFAILSTFGNG